MLIEAKDWEEKAKRRTVDFLDELDALVLKHEKDPGFDDDLVFRAYVIEKLACHELLLETIIDGLRPE